MSDVEPTREQPQALQPSEQKVPARTRAARTGAALLLVASANGLGPSITTREEPLSPSYSTALTVHDTPVEDFIPEKYARDFSADPEAGKLVHPSDVGKTVDQYEALLDQGYTLSDISIQGNASDEDETLNKEGEMTGGLGVKSEENVELAKKRSTVFEALLKKEFEARGLQVPEIDMLMPKEDKLQSKQIGNLIRLAQEGGFSSVLEMIEEYNNNDGSLPKGSSKVREQLDNFLGEDRNVIVTYNGTDTQGRLIKHDRKEKVPVLWTVPINVLNATLNGDKGPVEVQRPVKKIGKETRIYGRAELRDKNKRPREYNFIKRNRFDRPYHQDKGGGRGSRITRPPQRG